MRNAEIKYTLKLTKEPVKGKIVEIKTYLNELEESDLSDLLIEEGYYKSMGWPTDYYDILDREIILL